MARQRDLLLFGALAVGAYALLRSGGGFLPRTAAQPQPTIIIIDPATGQTIQSQQGSTLGLYAPAPFLPGGTLAGLRQQVGGGGFI